MLVVLNGDNFHHHKSMSGFPNRRQFQQHQDESLPDSLHEANQFLSGSSANRPSGAPLNPTSSSSAPSFDNMRLSQEQLMAASLSNVGANTGGLLPPLGTSRAAAMASFQDQLDAARTSSIYARMAQAQRAQQQLQREQQHQAMAAQLQLQQQHHQQQAAAAAAAAQQEELELNSLLLQKRQIDDMILNSALNSRRFSMGSDPFFGAASGALLPGQAATGLPMSMSASAASMMGTGPTHGANRNISNRPILGESDLLSGKIGTLGAGQRRMSMASWAEHSRRMSDPHHNRLGLQATAIPGMGGAMPGAAHDDAGFGGVYEEEDDETYFNDAGTDEVDRDFKRSQENFPLKLYRIIYEVVKSGRGDVISFFPHGRAFAVHKPKEFINEIMPKYFATGRMNTFLKQLNLYGFRRITEGRDKGGYFHSKFILGKRHMCKVIKRKKTDSKPAASKRPKSPEAKSSDAGRSSPVSTSTEAYAASLGQQLGKQRKSNEQGESKSPPDSPQSHPKLRWKKGSQQR